MIKTAWRELRHHRGRYLATVVAIAISVGFLAASSIVTATESNALARQAGAPYTQADLVVTLSEISEEVTSDQLVQTIKGASPAVGTVWPVKTTGMLLEHGDETAYLTVYAQPPTALSWAGAGSPPQAIGALPLAEDEVLLSPAAATSLGVTVGDLVDIGWGAEAPSWRVVALTDEPSTLLGTATAYVSARTLDALTGWPAMEYVVQVDPALVAGPAPAWLAASVSQALEQADIQDATVLTGAARLARAGAQITADIDTFKYLLWVFAGIALVVGLITVANTFTILLAQRRRQLGLLRAVGASGAQVRRSVLVEAVVLGLLGSLVGVGLAYALAAALGGVTGSIHYGLAFPAREVALAVALGVVITVAACVLPALRATRVSVLDALLPPQAAVSLAQRRVPARVIVCGLLVAVGLTACLSSMRAGGANALLVAVGGAGITSLGVLFAAPLFVPALLRLLGAPLARAGVAAQAGVKNLTRDPGRTSATATALMLAVGLIVTLQVGAATIRTTMTDKITSAYPVDLWIATWDPAQSIPPLTQAHLAQGRGVTASLVLDCRAAVVNPDTEYPPVLTLCAYDPTIAGLAEGAADAMPDDQIFVAPDGFDIRAGSQVAVSALTGAGLASGEPLILAAVGSNLVREAPFALVSPTVLASLDGAGSPLRQAVMLFAVDDAISGLRAVSDAMDTEVPLSVGGSAPQREMIEQVLAILVGVMTALLAVAVVIALVGVSNTLTLSVIERTRESALLRALGLRRGQLRAMLGIEALLLTAAATLVGVVFGVFFGFVGAHAIAGQVLASSQVELRPHYAIDWAQTLGLLAVLVLAAGLASVLPGRRAAAASPVEALAEV